MVVESSTVATTTAAATMQTNLHIEEILEPTATTLESSEQANMMVVVNSSAPEISLTTNVAETDGQRPLTEMERVGKFVFSFI